MKKLIKTFAAVAIVAAMFSCQKQDESGSMSIEEQYSYIDNTGSEALAQIEPADFQRLADLKNSLEKESGNIEFDDASQLRLLNMITPMLKLKGLVIDTDKISGTITIEGENATYNTGTGINLVYKTSENTYTATFSFTKGTKEVKLGTYKLDKADVDVYLILPTAMTVNVSDNSGIYCGATANNINCSSMPADWSDLTLKMVNCSMTGEGFINGKDSYRAVAEKLSVGNGKAAFNGTLYGREGKFLASGNGSANYTAKDEWDFDVDSSSIAFFGNIIEKIISKSNASGDADVYLNNSATPQFTVGISSEKVTFADGTVKKTSEVFNSTNMPKTYAAGEKKTKAFSEMFGLD